MRAEILTEADWRRLQSLRLAAAHAEPDVFGWALAREQGFAERHWRLRLRGGTWWAAVAGDGTDVGLLSMIEEPGAPGDERHLMGLWVASERRRQGAGQALVQAAARAATGAGAVRLTTWAHEDPGVDAFLSACGFMRTGERVLMPRQPSRAEERWGRVLAATIPTPRGRTDG